jgi:hypothetical protein
MQDATDPSGPIEKAVRPSFARQFHIAVVSWVSMLGTDLLLHAGLLSSLYSRPSPFLLEPAAAFALIPLGYLSFFILAALLTGLAVRLGVDSWRHGLLFGTGLGASIWAALVLGLASISTAPWDLLGGWFLGQTVELGVAGAVVGAFLQGIRPRRLWLYVVVWCVLAFLVTVLLQNLGWAAAAP